MIGAELKNQIDKTLDCAKSTHSDEQWTSQPDRDGFFRNLAPDGPSKFLRKNTVDNQTQTPKSEYAQVDQVPVH